MAERLRRPVCLTIGGSDSGGGAGVQADLKMFAAHGAHGCSAITALTAQNPAVVSRIEPVSLAQLDAEIHAVFDYFDVVAVKTGMLFDAERIALVAALLSELHDGLLVVDPVMVSTSGASLLDAGAVDTLAKSLLPMATLITPNLAEAEVLSGEPVGDGETSVRKISGMFGTAVLLKGGHGSGDELTDLLCEADGHVTRFAHPRQDWGRDELHGTGCRLASGIAARLAAGDALPDATATAITYLQAGEGM